MCVRTNGVLTRKMNGQESLCILFSGGLKVCKDVTFTHPPTILKTTHILDNLSELHLHTSTNQKVSLIDKLK